jgi:hypothetical protein
MPSHKEVLQKRFDTAEHAYTEAANEATRLDGQVKVERKAIDELTDKYNTACRQLATGAAGTEPAAILAERDRRSHRLLGLETLFSEATDSMKPLHDERQAAGSALQAELNREELERLWSLVRAAEQRKKEAIDALAAASRELDRAVGTKDAFRKQMERNAESTVGVA